MKKATFSSRGPSSRIRIIALSLGIAMSGLYSQADAVAVDSELVLLVDITQRGLNSHEFEDVMNGYANAMTSSQVLDSIGSGAQGKIAVSLVFYGNSLTHVVGIPWMMVSNAAEAQQFANLARDLYRPLSINSPSIDTALNFATDHFGTETGGKSNGFESTVQIIEVAAASLPLFPDPGAVKEARNDALASGVEVINAVAVGNSTRDIKNFFAANVVGGELAGVAGSSTSVKANNSLGNFLSSDLAASIEDGGTASMAVPEPSGAVLISAAGFLLLRRRRNHSRA
jgi:hypothetical protein